MLAAWYLHSKFWQGRAWHFSAGASLRGVFCANSGQLHRSSVFTLAQLQIIQVGVSLCLFILFSIFVMKYLVKLDFVWDAHLHDSRSGFRIRRIDSLIT